MPFKGRGDDGAADRLDLLVADTCRRYPDAAALEIGHAVLSYRGLAQRASRIASLVRETCSEVPARIGLIDTRDVGCYAAYLAILQLGATVVPMSTTLPTARLAAVADNAGLGLVLAATPAVKSVGTVRFQPGAEAGGVTVLRAWPTGAVPVRHRDDLAYILFTSGSTGRPKGVPISHGNVLSFLRYNITRYELGPGCRMSQMFDLSFDVSVYDMFGAWGSGATLVVPGPADALHAVGWVNTRGITHWASVPSVISAARRLGELTPGSMPSLRLSLFIGEQLTREQAESWQRAAPQASIENFYGPTELTVAVSGYRLSRNIAEWPETANRTIPIGRVYPHLETMLIGEQAEPGVGELCVRGPQRFGGYLDERDNAGRFAAVRGGRLVPCDGAAPPAADDWYRTGDQVHRGADGVLTHLGRIDQQVKVRGFRVELSEIEGILRLHPAVEDAAVITTAGAVGSQELVAFYTGTQEPARMLREHLAVLVPPYMIPRRILHLASFPLTTSGKTDRLALAAQVGEPRAARAARPPQDKERQADDIVG
jgi:amino acid adenylation domain-containing protein